MADVGVHEIGEVERRSTSGKLLHIALRRKDVDLILEDIKSNALEELRGVGDVALPLEQLAQPGELRVVGGICLRAILIAPVRSDSNLGDLMHGPSANLHLERTPIECNDSGVQALIEIVLRHGDVVVKLIWNRSPDAVDRTERGVAVAQVLHDHTDGIDVINLREVAGAARHLLVD